MAALPREQLEDWVERWLQVNRDAEKAGDWKPLADFYADDATYGWNIGPKEDVMCIGDRRDPRHRTRFGDGRPRGMEVPVPEGGHRRQDRRDRRILEADRHGPNDPDGSEREIYGIGGSWFRLTTGRLQDRVAA